MSRSSASRPGTARVAVVGAATPCGSRLREALAEAGVPGSRVALYGARSGEVVLSEYDGEARLIDEPDADALGLSGAVFLCEASAASERVASLASPATRIIDLADALRGESRRRLVHVDANPEAARNQQAVLAVPHELAVLLVDLLQPLERSFGVSDATALVVRPAADFGDAGLEELREQTVRLLSFDEGPRDVFGRQLAFNVIPQFELDPERHGEERRVAAEVAEVLGWEACRLAVRLVVAPVFHGHAVQLRVRCSGVVPPDRARAALAIAGSSAAVAATPIEVGTERETVVADVSDDGAGGLWLWAVAGHAAARRARLAVRLAETVCDL